MARVPSAARIRERFPARLQALTTQATGRVLDLATVADVGTAAGHEVIRAGAPYDTIVSVGVLGGLGRCDQLESTARLLSQVLAPGGRLLFAEPEARAGPDVRGALWRNGFTVIDSRPWRRNRLPGGRGGRTVIGGVARLTPVGARTRPGPRTRS